VIAVDTNVLVYARRAELPHHAEALQALRSLATGSAAWALPVFCIGEFIRVVTQPRLFDPPTTPDAALAAIDGLLASPSARLLSPGPRYWTLLGDLVRAGAATGNLVFDAQIAAVCLEHGASTILTEDRNFARFPGIARRPLVP
jgi:hypothetical protein